MDCSCKVLINWKLNGCNYFTKDLQEMEKVNHPGFGYILYVSIYSLNYFSNLLVYI